MKKEHNATPESEASPLSSCELALEDLEFVDRELSDEELELVVGGNDNSGVSLNVKFFENSGGLNGNVGFDPDLPLF